jgi:hypothetical protein
MTPGAIITYRLLMDIEMAGCASGFRLRKFKRDMTLTAIDQLVLALKLKASCVVRKRNGVLRDRPAIRRMAIAATDP